MQNRSSELTAINLVVAQNSTRALPLPRLRAQESQTKIEMKHKYSEGKESSVA